MAFFLKKGTKMLIKKATPITITLVEGVTTYNFPRNAELSNRRLYALEVYNATLFPKGLNGKTLITTALVQDAFITLQGNNSSNVIDTVPLQRFSPIVSLVNPPAAESSYFPGLLVNWETSSIRFATPTIAGDAGKIVYLIAYTDYYDVETRKSIFGFKDSLDQLFDPTMVGFNAASPSGEFIN